MRGVGLALYIPPPYLVETRLIHHRIAPLLKGQHGLLAAAQAAGVIRCKSVRFKALEEHRALRQAGGIQLAVYAPTLHYLADVVIRLPMADEEKA